MTEADRLRSKQSKNPSSTFSTKSAACSASTGIRRPPTSRTWASTRSSIAGRNRRASSRPTASRSSRIAGWAWSPTFSTTAIIAELEGTSAIGHNRYSTTGSTTIKNCQPLVVEYARGGLALAHNGNLVNFEELRERLEVERLDLPIVVGQRGDDSSDRGVARADAARAS